MNLQSVYISYTCPECHKANKGSRGNWMNKSWNKMVDLDTKLSDMQNLMKSQLETFRAFLMVEFADIYGKLNDMKEKFEQDDDDNKARATYAYTLKKKKHFGD